MASKYRATSLAERRTARRPWVGYQQNPSTLLFVHTIESTDRERHLVKLFYFEHATVRAAVEVEIVQVYSAVDFPNCLLFVQV